MTTATPTTTSEWQLHKVLLRANLLQYYEIFISQGGDDVQQLCEAGEEEFLEIMALVGMASKPLHVRRLQKALQEWVANPAIFQSSQSSFQPHLSPQNVNSVVPNYSRSTTPVTNNAWTPVTPARNSSPSDQTGSSAVSNQSEMDIKFRSSGSLSPVPTPILTEGQINAIAESAMKLARELPAFEPKSLNPKKPINRDIQTVMCLSEDDPNRMEEIRKYAAIYGRFDSKRKNDKPMSLHEISVNEASAQLCRHIPALLTRREDLFPLARQVVRDSGYQYSKGQSSNPWNGLKRKNSNSTELDFSPLNERAGETLMVKKQKLDPSFQRLDGNQKNATAELDKIQREERMTAINQELLQISQKQEKLKSMASEAKDSGDPETITKIQAEIEAIVQQQMQLLTEQSEIIRRQRRYQMNKVKGVNGNNLDGEDDVTDSSNVPSGGSSPQYSHDGEEYDAYTNALQLATGRGPSTESLFDEGLRIAQQYGMADFADSLKELQDMKDDDDDNMEEEENQDDSTSNSVTTEKPSEAMDKPVENGGKSSLSVLLSNESNSKIEPLNGSSEMY